MDPEILKFAQFLGVVATFGAVGIAFIAALRIAIVRTRPKPQLPSAMGGIDEARFARLEQAVDAIAIEVERIAEGQRFTTKLMAERVPERLPAPTNQSS